MVPFFWSLALKKPAAKEGKGGVGGPRSGAATVGGPTLCEQCGQRPIRADLSKDGTPYRKCPRCLKGKGPRTDRILHPNSTFETRAKCVAYNKDGITHWKGLAVAGSNPARCRMHGGKVAGIGLSAPNFKHGRYSRFLPADMVKLFEQANANPELLEMSEHIALLEARIQAVLAASAAGDPVPTWAEFSEVFADLETVVLAGETDRVVDQLARMHRILDAGMRWDTTWQTVGGTMEQLRKVVDTEVKRKKELNQMVPIERIMVLMSAVAMAVKRNVTNPAEIDAVQREMAMLLGSNSTSASNNHVRIGPEVIDVTNRVSR